MIDLTLTSELYNNIKFNMHKLILDVEENHAARLAAVFGASEEEVQEVIDEMSRTVREQAERLRKEIEIPAVTESKTIAFVGDSITSDRASYLNILREIYREEEKLKFVDAAVSGDKSDDAVMKFYFRTMNYHPDVAHILIGTNDLRRSNDPFGGSAVSLSDYRKNLSYMLQVFQENQIPVVISQIAPVLNERLWQRFPEDNWIYDYEEMKEANRIVCEVAAAYGAKLNAMEEVYKEYEPGELLLKDGLHLNEKGQYLLTKQVIKALAEYL